MLLSLIMKCLTGFTLGVAPGTDIGAYGWVVWGLLVFTGVLEDLVNGIKLISLAASRSDMHCFCGSAIIVTITTLAVWTSATYNRAIAMSSTELIVNAVILLFVNDIDEQIYNAAQVIGPKITYVTSLSKSWHDLHRESCAQKTLSPCAAHLLCCNTGCTCSPLTIDLHGLEERLLSFIMMNSSIKKRGSSMEERWKRGGCVVKRMRGGACTLTGFAPLILLVSMTFARFSQAQSLPDSIPLTLSPAVVATAARAGSPPRLLVDTKESSNPAPSPASSLDMSLQTLTVPATEMNLVGVLLPLSKASEKAFEEIAATTISNAITRILGASHIQSLEVQVSYIRPTKRRLGRMIQGSILFADSKSRELTTENLLFETIIEIQSVIQTHDAERYIGAAFNDGIEKLQFLESLKASGYLAFANISSVSVSTAESYGKNDNTENDSSNTLRTVALIVIPVACVAAVGMAFAVFYVRIHRQKKEPQRKNPLGTPPPHFNVNDIGSEIEIMTANVEMSSLGEPSHAGIHYGAPSCNGTSVMSSSNVLSLNYEFQKALADDQDPSFLGSQDTGTLPTKDDKTLEAEYMQNNFMTFCFEVDAPAGTIGLVMETGKNGTPIVYMIRSSSPLFGEVQVGDRLMSVDGIDVAGMATTDVSRLIASKKNDPSRTFVFARIPHGHDDDEQANEGRI